MSDFEDRRLEQLNAELMEQIGDMEGYIEELESQVSTLAYQLAEYEGTEPSFPYTEKN